MSHTKEPRQRPCTQGSPALGSGRHVCWSHQAVPTQAPSRAGPEHGSPRTLAGTQRASISSECRDLRYPRSTYPVRIPRPRCNSSLQVSLDSRTCPYSTLFHRGTFHTRRSHTRSRARSRRRPRACPGWLPGRSPSRRSTPRADTPPHATAPRTAAAPRGRSRRSRTRRRRIAEAHGPRFGRRSSRLNRSRSAQHVAIRLKERRFCLSEVMTRPAALGHGPAGLASARSQQEQQVRHPSASADSHHFWVVPRHATDVYARTAARRSAGIEDERLQHSFSVIEPSSRPGHDAAGNVTYVSCFEAADSHPLCHERLLVDRRAWWQRWGADSAGHAHHSPRRQHALH